MNRSLFQSTVLKKHLSALSQEKIGPKYDEFTQYFGSVDTQEALRNIKEEEFQDGFLRELFVKIFGYTLKPDTNFNLVREKKNETNAEKADAAILVNENIVGVVELKDLRTPDLASVEKQAFGYKNRHRKAKYVIVSNFQKVRFYIDNAVDYLEFDLFDLSKENFELLYLCLSWESIKNDLPAKIKDESIRCEMDITERFYKDYSAFKNALFEDICAKNPQYDQLTLFRKTQKLLDRLLFILFAEDKGLLNPNEMKKIIRQWENVQEWDTEFPLYNRIKKYFLELSFGNEKGNVFAYNGGLFQTDEILDSVLISDSVLKEHSLKLSQYDFDSEVDVDILGHIFEHSLSEIEEITNRLNENNGDIAAITKRKKDGIFYTPKYITDYIIKSTLGVLCEKKKAELNLRSEMFEVRKRNKKDREKLHALLDEYRNWLLDVKICDPACGSGAFLNQALDFLIREHRQIDEFHTNLDYGNTSKGKQSVFLFQDVETAILENNLYGVDINEESVDIAKLALWLRSAKQGRKLNDLSNRIKLGDSLIDDPTVDPEKAFDWKKEFPEVFEKGGFDCVVGNPPYVRQNKNSFRSAFFEWNSDLYLMFFEKVFKHGLLKSEGMFGFIVPRYCLVNKENKNFRDFLLNDVHLTKLLETAPFEEANTENIVFTIENAASQNDTISVFQDVKEKIVAKNQISKTDCQRNAFCEILTFQTGEIIKLLKKIEMDAVLLEKISTSKRGMEIGKKNLDSGNKPCLIGEDVSRYAIVFLEKYVDAEHPEFLRLESTFNESQLYLRRVASTVIAAVSKKHYAFNKNIYGLAIEKKYHRYYILALLNSKLLTFYYRNKFSTKKVDLFPEIQTYLFNALPIKKIPLAEQKEIIELAKKISTLTETVSKTRNVFLRRLSDNLSKDLKITKKLESFENLCFREILEELGKQKIKIPLKKQDEWIVYFQKYQSLIKILQQEIEAADEEIDQKIYLLYGLSESEIELVENHV